MTTKDEAIRELAHVANALLDHIRQIDKTTPPIFIMALENKIKHYVSVAE